MNAVDKDLQDAVALGRRVSDDAGLTVLHGETPTEHQARVAALHAREDAAASMSLQISIIRRLDRHVWYLRFIVFVLLLILGNR